jgi:hypothetical protein
MKYMGQEYSDHSDFAEFLRDTAAFVEKCVPDAKLEDQGRAAIKIVQQFRYLFNEYGARIR